MFCGTRPDGYTTTSFIADYKDRADAILAVIEVFNRWAAEVGIPPKPESVDTTPVSDEESAFCNGYERRDGTRGHAGYCPVHGWHCPMCGEPERGHDQAACDEKMCSWRPTGIL
jgi:hypothetical protein